MANSPQIITRLDTEDYTFFQELGPELLSLELISKISNYELGRYFITLGMKYYVAERNKIKMGLLKTEEAVSQG